MPSHGTVCMADMGQGVGDVPCPSPGSEGRCLLHCLEGFKGSKSKILP